MHIESKMSGRDKAGRGLAVARTFLLLGLLAAAAQPALLPASDTRQHPGRTDLGFSYQNDRDTDVPWSIHIIKIDRANPDL